MVTPTTAPALTPVDGEDADVSRHVGKQVAEYRRARGLKVAELARRVGVTGSLISQIERGRARPSISTLFLLGEALDVPMDSFFKPESRTEQPAAVARVNAAREVAVTGMHPPRRSGSRSGAKRFVVRREDRATIEIAGGVRWEQLTPGPVEEGEFLEAVYAPHSESSPELYRHPGTEWLLVLEGTLEITVAFNTVRLEAGDSMCFPSPLPHRYANPTDKPARAVSVNLWDPPARHAP
jgi:DNA-binding XRE family transcriptional regulator